MPCIETAPAGGLFQAFIFETSFGHAKGSVEEWNAPFSAEIAAKIQFAHSGRRIAYPMSEMNGGKRNFPLPEDQDQRRTVRAAAEGRVKSPAADPIKEE